MDQAKVTLEIFRFDPDSSEEPHYAKHTIPYSNGLTVLDGLIYIYENIDTSLSFRWSCKNVQCGACGMMVNGDPVLACERKLSEGEKVKIEPFPLPIVKDLVSDLSSIEDRGMRVISKPVPGGRPEILSPEEVGSLIPLHKCLDCHICDIVCPLNKGKKVIEPGSFLASDLVQLASLVFNKREGENRIGQGFSKKMYQCLTCGACVRACPAGIDIVNDAIEKLRQAFIKRDGEPYRRLFDPKEWVERWVELKGEPFLKGAREEYRVSNPKGRVGFFVGCLMNRRQQELARTAVEALNRAQYDVIIPRGQKCCGQPLLRLGMVDEAKDLLRRNIALLEAAEVKQAVTACPDCSYAFKEDYQKLFGDGERQPRVEVLDLVKLLPFGGQKHSIACHNPCYLSRRGIWLSDELKAKGFEIGEVFEECCGAGGGVYFTNATVGQEVGRRVAKGIGADAVVTGCPFCKEQFEKVADGKKVYHYLELIG